MVKHGKARSETDGLGATSGDADQTKVQSYASVIGINAHWEINAASENVGSLVGQPAASLLGQPLVAVLHEEVVHRLRSLSQVLSSQTPVLHYQGLKLVEHDASCDVTLTLSGKTVFFEFEEAETVPDLATGLEQIQRLVHRVAGKSHIDDAAFEAARTMQALSEFDRVSVHQMVNTGLDAPLGLAERAPLSAAPDETSLKAHAANFCAHLHLVPDIEGAVEALLLAESDELNGSLPDASGLCSFGPSDDLCSALTAQEVRAALTIPIRVGGALWGLFICHHSEPKTLSVGRRSALALFSLLFGYELERLHERVGIVARGLAKALRSKLVAELNKVSDFPDAVMGAQQAIADILPHDGFAVWYRGEFRSWGRSLSQAEFEPVFSHLQWPEPGQVTALNKISEIDVVSEHLDPEHTALLVVPISVVARDYVLLFRDTSRHTYADKAWLPWEIENAASTSGALIESHSKLIEDLLDFGTDDRGQKGLLISELNHRVRNMLNLIRGMISQAQVGATDVESYARELEARVFALARAHDQLTDVEWSWLSLHGLIAMEVDELVAGLENSPFTISGLEIDLSPTAYTTLALVLHELVSNARKYGALSQPGGRIEINISRREDGFAEITWVESGGPAVEPPNKVGFGLTIVEQSVPFELRGFSDIRFEPTGLNARFLVPPGHIRRHKDAEPASAEATGGAEEFESVMSIDGAAMVVEDSLIIAIEAADMLRAAGATKVYSCNSVESAFRVLDVSDISFALLDVNLGEESSLAIAEQLWSDDITAVLATGYGSDKALLKEFPPMPLLTKPYDISDLKDVLRTLNKERKES